MRSDCATSQTIVRLPARAAAKPSEAATVVFPTPPFPVMNSRRLSSRDAIGQKDSSPIVRIRTPRQGLFDQRHPPETKRPPDPGDTGAPSDKRKGKGHRVRKSEGR